MNAEERAAWINHYKDDAKRWADLISKWDRLDTRGMAVILAISLWNSLTTFFLFLNYHPAAWISFACSAFMIALVLKYRRDAQITRQKWLSYRSKSLQLADQLK